jgi:hypothetical protein
MNECNYTIHMLRLSTGPCHFQAWRAHCVGILSVKLYCGLKHVVLYEGTACLIYCIFLHLVLTRAVKIIVYVSGKRNISSFDQLYQLTFFSAAPELQNEGTWQILSDPNYIATVSVMLSDLGTVHIRRETSANIHRFRSSKNFQRIPNENLQKYE